MSPKQQAVGDFGHTGNAWGGGGSRIGLKWMKWFNVSESASPPGNGTIWAPNWHQVNCLPLSHSHTAFCFTLFLFQLSFSQTLSYTHITVSLLARPVQRWPVLDKQRPVLSDYNDGWPPVSHFIGISQESLHSQAKLQVNSLLSCFPKSLKPCFWVLWQKKKDDEEEIFHDFIRPELVFDRAVVNDGWMWLAESGIFISVTVSWLTEPWWPLLFAFGVCGHVVHSSCHVRACFLCF